MGWQGNNVYPLLIVTTQTGQPTGLFIYDPAPGAGNLLASITAATADPYGNTTTPGITLYDSSGNPRIELATGSEPYLQLLNPQGAVVGLLSNRDDALLWYEDTSSATQGALVASIAGKAGSDFAGNSFPLGAEIFQGVFNGTNYVLNADGAFFYSTAPALGNLVASIASASGTDSYGNAYYAGITSYDQGSGQYAQLGEYGTVSVGSISAGQAGELTEGAQVVIESGTTAGVAAIDPGSTLSTHVDLVAPPGSSGGYALIYGYEPTAQAVLPTTVGVLGTVVPLIDNGTGVAPTLETTHGFGSLGVTGLDITTANYYMLPDGGVYISIKGHATAAVSSGSATFPNALPSGYRPATSTELPVSQGGTQVAGNNLPHCYVQTSGAVTLYYADIPSGSSISVQARLDLQ